jgi:WD40 repeat protein
VDSIELAADEWERNGRAPAWLDHRADRLAAAERVAGDADFRRRLGRPRIDYLEACRARENRRRQIAGAVASSLAAVIAIALVLGFQAWQQRQGALRAQKQAEVSLLIAQSQTNWATSGNITRALEQAERAYKLIPTAASRSALLEVLGEISPHVKRVVPFDDGPAQTLAWTSDDRLDVATASWRLLTFDVTSPTERRDAWILPSIKRPEGNPSFVRALARLDSERMVAVFDQGSIGLYRRGSTTMALHAPQQGISVDAIQHTAAVSASGTLIALATADGPIFLYRCNWGKAGQSTSPCSSGQLGDVRGRVVAISPDETRVAVGDGNTVTIYSLSGGVIGGGPRTFPSLVTALGWAEQRDWLAVGTDNGRIAVFDPAAESGSFVTEQSFGDRPVNALAWKPKELGLAFVCNETSVCLLQATPGTEPAEPFKPAIRFEGHGATVTRVSFAPNGAQLASIAVDNTMRVWSLAQDTDATFALYADRDGEFSTVAVSPDRQWVAGGSKDGTIQLWDAKSGVASLVFKPSESSEVRDLGWNYKGAVASVNVDNANQTVTVNVVSTDTRRPPINIPTRTSSRYLTWAEEDRMITLPTGEGGVILLNPSAPNDAPVRIDGDRTGESWGVATVPGTRLLLVSYVGGTIRLLDLASKQVVGSMQKPGEKVGVGSLSVSPDMRLLATSSGDSSVPVYDIAKRAIFQLLKTESPQISTAAFSPNGQKLAALGSDNWLYIWTLGESEPELYLALPVITRRVIVGNVGNDRKSATWLAWASDDHVAIAIGTAAISVLNISPTKWLKRLDGLALTAKP